MFIQKYSFFFNLPPMCSSKNYYFFFLATVVIEVSSLYHGEVYCTPILPRSEWDRLAEVMDLPPPCL